MTVTDVGQPPARAPGCDFAGDSPPVYYSWDAEARAPRFVCRCVVCARCGHHTGNTSQGHYWRLCTRTGHMEVFHFCCPGDCELGS